MLESNNNRDMPKSNSRRRFLSEMLKIPPVLLGLPLFSDSGIVIFIDMNQMLIYENVLSLMWGLYYSGNFQQATSNISLWLNFLDISAKGTSGVARDQLRAMQCRFLQLSGTAARDRAQPKKALQDIGKSIEIATELNNMELLVASYYHRFRVYEQQQQYNKSQADVRVALRFVNYVPDALAGTIFVASAEVATQLANLSGDVQAQKESLTYLNRASQIARKSTVEPDISYIQFDLARVQIESAYSFSRFGMQKDAHNALAVAQKMLPLTNARRQKDLHMATAESCLYVDDDVDGCCKAILDALSVINETKSRSSGKWMVRLLNECKKRNPQASLVNKVEEKLYLVGFIVLA